MNDQLLNDELLRLLEKHNLSQSELARRIDSKQNMISNICRRRRNLGERLFVKMLRKGFGYSEKEVEDMFLSLMKKKYLRN